MEEYEEFCKRHLARIQTQMMENNSLQSIWQKSNSVICFHGIAALCPLMNTERKLEMQQYRQKAVELEINRQKLRKSALLNRVQEIIENVQVCKVPSTTECMKDPVTQPPTKNDPTNNFTTIQHTDHSSVSPSYSEKPEDTILSTQTLLNLKDKVTIQDSEKSVYSSQINDLPNATCSIQPDNALSVCVSPKEEESKTDVISPTKESPDHYAMSLQNLLKKSREYVEREQNRRNSKNASKEVANESHSDKENEGVKINDWERERNRISNNTWNSSPVTVDESSSARSFSQSQVASTSSESFELYDKTAISISTSILCSSLKVDFPAKSIKGLSRESDSDDDWINSTANEHESSLLKSLVGSYAKLPNPEPSRSPKMHQRRPRPSTHIVINNPVNAYELSPKEKFKGLPGTHQGKRNVSNLDIKRAVPNEALIAGHQKETEKIPGKLQDIPTCLGRVNDIPTTSCSQLCAEPSGKSEVKMVGPIVGNEVQVPLRTLIQKDSYDLERTSPLLINNQEIIQPLEAQDEFNLSGHKASSPIEKAKQGSPIELNKSYDVRHPSPVLLQTQNRRQQTDFAIMPSESETSLQSSIEAKAKRKLALDTLSAKENKRSIAGSNAQEIRWICEERHQRVSVSRSETEVPSKSHNNTSDEELITKQMMAFVEMRKQLEEQHTLQLSMLIAEQEKEQEKLRREIEEQERLFREQRNFVMESSESRSSKETSLDWRRINENYPMLSLINGVDGHRPSISPNTAFTSNSASAESSFSRWRAGDEEVHEMQSSCFLRPRSRRSQMNTPEVQKKFNKVTAVAKGFLTRRLMKTEKLKQLQQTIKDTLEFINSFQTEAPLKRGAVSSQDVSLHERVIAQLRAALYEIHDIFFVLSPDDRMQILCHDREIRKEKQLRQMEKWKSPRERGALSVATQKSLDRKRQIKAAEMGIICKQKSHTKQKTSSETRILQPSQGQNAPAQRLLHRQGVQTSRKGVEQNRERYTESRFPSKAVPGACPGRVRKTKSSVTTL
ncbi:centriolar coiled-coil protein of 110 kDa-like isoform X1 [Carcharodon carcharias]|uniref:centriolar coiled-coil protein of 110 kDa-like isoform X1 n=2 Tax=Carcharodon carcharias TaxID=13397 RepID=UPI001B7F58DC|nr:centriolar coiled-coil protein of 110 kDa-like isoform X1 [Carcharodon carcharias]